MTIRRSWIPYEPAQREEDPSGTILGGSSNGRTQVSGTCYLGSNPSPPAKHTRSHRLAVRTLASHARNAGSIPAGITNFDTRGWLRAPAKVGASSHERAEVNFLLHRFLAKRQIGDALGGIGAMLPDFWRMAHRRMRPRRLEWGSDASSAALRLLAGVRHHVESDSWFHARLGFAREEAETVAALRGAAAELNKIGMFGHAAWEMCLDGALLLRDGPEQHLQQLREDFGTLDRNLLWEVAARTCGDELAADPTFRVTSARIIDGLLEGSWILGYCVAEGLVDRLSGIRRRVGLDVIVEPQRGRLIDALGGRLEEACDVLPALLTEAQDHQCG